MSEKISLYYQSGNSDKVYHVQLEESDGLYVVNFQYGRRGSTLNTGTKTGVAVSYDSAKIIYDKVVSEKLAKGYSEGSGGSDYTPAQLPAKGPTDQWPSLDTQGDFIKDILPQLLNPIEDDELEKYLKDDSYGAQEKKDGKHQMLTRTSKEMKAFNKKGKEIGFPTCWTLKLKGTILDGEAIGDIFYAFDLLKINGNDYRKEGYLSRHKRLLKASFGPHIKIVPLAVGYEAKIALYEKLKRDGKEGIVFKKLDAPHTSGRPNSGGDMLKFKFYKTLSARVSGSRAGKRSVKLELYNGSSWVDMGNVTIPPNKDVPSIGDIVEIKYLYAHKGGSLYQPIYLEPRDDVDAEECLMSQVKYKALEPDESVRKISW